MRRGITVALSAADRAQLEAMVAGRGTRRKHAWRARIVLLAAAGCSLAEIMRQTGKSKPTVWHWHERFMSTGVAGLLRDQTRKAGKPPLAAATVERVVRLTQQLPPGGKTRWTGRMMAAAVGISLRSVQRIWRLHQFPPDRGVVLGRHHESRVRAKVRHSAARDIAPPVSSAGIIPLPRDTTMIGERDLGVSPLAARKPRSGKRDVHSKEPGSPREKANLKDVAERAGVGTATVDRVLNNRGHVRPETARRVIDAARQLHLRRTLPASYHRGLRLEVLLTRPELPLIGRISRAFADVAATLDRSVIVQRHLLQKEDAHQMAERLRSTRCNGIMIYGQEHPDITAAIAVLAKAGVPVVTLISDLPASSRLAYVGIDHYSAGRTAGFFVARMVPEPGPVIVLCNHFGYHSHSERVRGFKDSILQHGTGLVVAEVLEGYDDWAVSERLMLGALRRHRAAVGIYNAGAANRAVAAALRAAGMASRPVFVGHELTSQTRTMLQDGSMTLVIDQNPEQQARYAVDLLLHKFGYVENGHPTATVPFTLYGPENIHGVDIQ
jgi:LacI family transcriptional regulator